ncbi:MAG: type II toxin-antitoxin system HicB family antitoxin [Chloroflexaceae bacterium]|nr:type II toxin-antitoxin system HicB family antitoxin [Chloroflexaceae bacterium]
MHLTAVFVEALDGGYTVFVEEFPEVISQGQTLDEARENLRHALERRRGIHHAFAEQVVARGHRVIREPYAFVDHLPRDEQQPPAPTPARALLACAGVWEGDDLDACLDTVYATRQPVTW